MKYVYKKNEILLKTLPACHFTDKVKPIYSFITQFGFPDMLTQTKKFPFYEAFFAG
jgi:hypothetical protein